MTSVKKIEDYQQLQDAILNQANREDLRGDVEFFIFMAEKRIERFLRSKSTEFTATIQTDGTTGAVVLPDDFFKERSMIAPSENAPPLTKSSPEAQQNLFSASSSGVMQSYYIHGLNMTVAPVPTEVVDIDLIYFGKVVELSDVNDTNALLLNNPDVYLYAGLMELNAFIEDEDQLATYSTLFKVAADEINKVAKNRRATAPSSTTVADIT